MRTKSFANIVIFFVVLLLIFSRCRKTEKYPVEPVIAFQKFTPFDTVTQHLNGQTYLYFMRGVLQFSFTDGDGDLGVETDSNTTGGFANLFITYYEIQNKDTVQVPMTYYDNETHTYDTMTYNSVIPNLTPEYANGNGIKGEISDTLFLLSASSYDTIMFEVYVKDRKEHESNHFFTPYIVRRIKY